MLGDGLWIPIRDVTLAVLLHRRECPRHRRVPDHLDSRNGHRVELRIERAPRWTASHLEDRVIGVRHRVAFLVCP